MDTAKAILQIPLAQTKLQDVITWRWDNKSLYMVKEGYKCAWNNRLKEFETLEQQIKPSKLRDFRVLWKTIWRMDIQLKIKVFLWRSTRNILPIRQRLHPRVLMWETDAIYMMLMMNQFVTCFLITHSQWKSLTY